MGSNNRDDFTLKTKENLAKRVGYRCSNPSCQKTTIGPHSDPKKATNIGVAAHICAAAPGGPRYNPSMTSTERSSGENGIWLCQTCSALIDKDEEKYSVIILHEWKKKAEQAALKRLFDEVADSQQYSLPRNLKEYCGKLEEPVRLDDGSLYLGDWLYGMRHGLGCQRTAEGEYIGEWKHNMRHGEGVMVWVNHDYYNGNWENDVRSGQGKMEYADKSIYDGTWKDDKYNGEGVYTWPDDVKYTGFFKDNDRSGHGTFFFPDGSKCEGDWESNVICKEAHFSSGKTYKGDWKDYMPHGNGVMKWPDGSRYKGNWKDGLRSGQGTMEFLNGSSYSGNWKYGVYWGFGEYHYSYGCIYKGYWENGKRNGKGIYTWPFVKKYNDWVSSGDGKFHYCNGNYFSADWRDDEIIGEALLYQGEKCAGSYLGDWKNCLPHGNGTMKWTDGSWYQGNWEKGLRSGFGEYHDIDGSVYKGDWEKGRRHGHGKIMYINGDWYDGEWKNGEKDGEGTEKEGDYIRSGHYGYNSYYEEGFNSRDGVFVEYRIGCEDKKIYVGYSANNRIKELKTKADFIKWRLRETLEALAPGPDFFDSIN